MSHEIPKEEFIARRDKFISQMPNNSIAVISAAFEVTRSNDTEYPFCQNKNFYYLTGFNEPEAILVMFKGDEQTPHFPSSVLFCLEKDPLKETWQGRRTGPEKAQEYYGFDQCFILSELDVKIVEYLNHKSQILYCQGQVPSFDIKLAAWHATLKVKSRFGAQPPTTFVDCGPMIAEMRLIKSKNEINLMRKVNYISGLAHQRAMKNCRVGMFEYQIEAEILHEFIRNGARHPAYGSIVAGGDNANILHYRENCDPLKNNELLLIDAGGELSGYAADITRTFPINGRFSEEQKILYQLVLDAQQLAIEAIKPSMTLAQLNLLVCDFFTTQLHQLNILTGDLTRLLSDKASKKYFIHGLGHWLGLDVHDVGDYHVNEKREQFRPFEQGMVMTIEPGLYFPLDDLSVDKKWRGIGIRIEDNILVTATGYENLTANSPKQICEIEALMND